ncbi:MAG: PrpF domain-containing protein [Actinocatenispora sp.]
MRTRRIPLTIMRGGTSRGLYLNARDLVDVPDRDALILRLFGSPDPRQIDGLGGADLLTSKVAIVGPPTVPGADVDYTFGQVGVDVPIVDHKGNCGNISAGVGPYAVRNGYVTATATATDGLCPVRIHNTNTGKIIVAHVPVADGAVVEDGDVHIDGVPGTGAGIFLDYSRTAGAATGSSLPTGSPTDVVDVPGVGAVEVSVVDFANPVVYVRAADVGLTGTESPDHFRADPDVLDRLERIRAVGAVLCGMADDVGAVAAQSPTFPNLSVVAAPRSFRALTDGRTIAAGDADIVARIFAMRMLHQSYAGTGMSNLGAAATIPGTLVHDLVPVGPGSRRDVRVAHPCGVAVVSVETSPEGLVTRVGYERTARLIMEGTAFVPA